MLNLIIFLCPLFFIALGYVFYDEYTVYRIYLDDQKKIEAYSEIEKIIGNLDVFSQNGIEKFLDVMVSPKDQTKFLNLLENNNINHETYIENVGNLIDYSIPHWRRTAGSFNWTSYHNYDVMNFWLDSLAVTYPQIVTVFTAGYSHLGAAIKGVKVVFNSSASRVAVMEGGIHAREWINPAVTTYILNAFLTTTVPKIRAAADKLIWYFVPMCNPDGYNRTFYEDRMHRKNVQVVKGANCTGWPTRKIGTDINRNFGFNWMIGDGASSDPCDQTYAGPEPFSAPEARALKSVVDQVGNELVLYLSFHSYSQLILFPYGHTTTPLDNYYVQYAIGRMAADVMEAYNGTKYVVGNMAEAAYITSGSSTDWVKGTYGSTLVYCYELRDRGQYGFLLPEDQIIDNGQEALLSVVTLVEQLYRLDTLAPAHCTPANIMANPDKSTTGGAAAVKNNNTLFLTTFCSLIIYFVKTIL